jgi:hypothetical protein
MGKNIFTSKTIWVFLILFAVAILNATKITNLPLDQNAEWIIPILSVIAILLRLITKEPVNWNDKSK